MVARRYSLYCRRKFDRLKSALAPEGQVEIVIGNISTSYLGCGVRMPRGQNRFGVG